jgi:type II secretory pathway pseudopilin PulG
MTLIEVMLSATVMVVGLLGFLGVTVMAIDTSSANREADLATDAARQAIETMQAADFADAFRLFNADPADDPGGAGTAPGNAFAVAGLDPLPTDPDGTVGEIILPAVAVGGSEELREDVQEAVLGMPRDLNGDGLQDALDHAADYGILPVLVRLEWRGATGAAAMEFKTLLAPY